MATTPAMFPQLKSRRGKGGKRDDLGGAYFRSSWEANYARYLNFLIKHGEIDRWEFEVKTFEFPIKRGSKFYTPDFKVWDLDGTYEWHEVKGFMDQKSATKLKRMTKYYPKEKVVIVGQKEYGAIEKKVAALIPGWEKRR